MRNRFDQNCVFRLLLKSTNLYNYKLFFGIFYKNMIIVQTLTSCQAF